MEVTPSAFDRFDEETTRVAARFLAEIETAAKKVGVKCTLVHTLAPSPAEEIVRTAKKQKCDLIVMASHGRKGVARLLLGSETSLVLTHAHIPVLVTR
jgi:nucleotide-binding universal stress UspA family protein